MKDDEKYRRKRKGNVITFEFQCTKIKRNVEVAIAEWPNLPAVTLEFRHSLHAVDTDSAYMLKMNNYKP